MAIGTNEGLRTRLSAIVIVIVALVMLPALMFGDAYLERQTRAQAEAQLQTLSRLVRGLVEVQYASLGTELSLLADAMSHHFDGAYSATPGGDAAMVLQLDNAPLAGRSAELARFGDERRGTLAALLVRDGQRFKVLASTHRGKGEASPVLLLNRATVDVLEAGRRWQGGIAIEDRRYLLELIPVREGSGRLLGLMAVGLDLAQALQPLRAYLRDFVIGDGGYLYVVDANSGPDYGRFIVHPLQQGETPFVAPDGVVSELVAHMLAGPEGIVDYTWQNAALGETEPRAKIVAVTHSAALGWVIGASGYREEFGRGAAQLRYAVGVSIALMALLLMFGLNFVIGRMVMRPMLRLQRTLRTLSRGNETLVHSDNEPALVGGVCDVLVREGGFRLALIESIDENGVLVRVAAAGDADRLMALLEAGNELALAPSRRALEVRSMIRVTSTGECPPALRGAALQAGCQALIAFPLIDGGTMLGVLTIGSARVSDLDQAGVALLKELAEDLGYGMMSLRTAHARDVAEGALRLREQAIEATRDGVLILGAEDGRYRIRDANPAAGKILGVEPQALLGATSDALGALDVDAVLALEQAFSAQRASVLELEGVRPDGEAFWSECAVAPVVADGAECVVLVIKDVTERTLYLRQIEHQARFDPLTGLPNRSLLDDRLEQAIIGARRHRCLLAVAYLDLDHFKRINDNLGHRTGDRLLREVAGRLQSVLRDGDTAARQGGDEFVVLLPGLEGQDQAYAVLQRVQQALMAPVIVDGHQFFVTCSMGVSLYPQDGDDDETLLKHADIAMYQAKESGRDAIRFFTPEMNERVQDRLMLEQALRQALARDELHVAYQPQVVSATGRVVGAEALLRWTHPELGSIAPDRFIPMAEELGLIEAIGEWVLRTACLQALAWQSAGQPLRVAVNVSVRQFRSVDFPARVAAVLEETGLDPSMLELEITESMLMGNVEAAEETLKQLKQLGLALALDDFGTGYSSFAYLQRFPIDTLKVDQTFVRGMLAGSRAVSIVTAIVAMAHSLGMRAIAEGVELPSQQRQLTELGCDELQGYFLGRPVKAEDFRAGWRDAGAISVSR